MNATETVADWIQNRHVPAILWNMELHKTYYIHNIFQNK